MFVFNLGVKRECQRNASINDIIPMYNICRNPCSYEQRVEVSLLCDPPSPEACALQRQVAALRYKVVGGGEHLRCLLNFLSLSDILDINISQAH